MDENGEKYFQIETDISAVEDDMEVKKIDDEDEESDVNEDGEKDMSMLRNAKSKKGRIELKNGLRSIIKQRKVNKQVKKFQKKMRLITQKQKRLVRKQQRLNRQEKCLDISARQKHISEDYYKPYVRTVLREETIRGSSRPRSSDSRQQKAAIVPTNETKTEVRTI